jgi:GntR family transcriptional regulator
METGLSSRYLLAKFAGDDLSGRPIFRLARNASVLCVIVLMMIPFSLTFEPGVAVYEQVVYAATKAIISGQMRAGDPFPSVRELSKALKINPNTAHKVVLQLISDGLLEVQPGRGTFVAVRTKSTASERGVLLKKELEQVVVEAKRLGLELDEVTAALEQHWARLERKK